MPRDRRKKSQAEWEADPKKNKLIVALAQSGSLTQASRQSGVPYGTAKSWTGDQRFHIALRRILDERGAGLHKAARVIDEAMDAERLRIDYQGNEWKEKDHKIRLIAARLILEVYDAMDSQRAIPPDSNTPNSAVFEDVVLDLEEPPKDESSKNG